MNDLERRVLGGILVTGVLPDVAMEIDDFSDGLNRQVFEAMVAVAVRGEAITSVSVWHQDPRLHPADVCEVLGDFVSDDSTHGYLPPAYAMALHLRAQHRRRRAA
jgi:hypothetical protein